MPPRSRPSSSAAISPPFTLSVATKLTIWSEARAESTITVGTPSRFASSTGRTSAFSSRGARTIPSTPWLANDSTTCTCCSRSSSRRGPFQRISTVDALRGEVALGLDRPGVDRAPELVGRALGDEGDAERSCRRRPSAPRPCGSAGKRARPASEEGEGDRSEAHRVRPSRPGRWPRSSGHGSRSRIDWFAMWAARAASTPTRIGAVGVLRVRMQSSQFARCALVPSASERTRISGSGVVAPGLALARVLAVDDEPLPVDLERRLVPAELEPAVVDRARVGARVRDHEVLRVLEGRGDGVRPVHRLDPVLRRGHHRGAGRRHAHVPVHHVDPVGEEVGQHSAAEVAEVPPAEEALGVPGLVRRGAEPGLPVELRLVHRGPGADAHPLVPVGVDERDLAQLARVDDLLAEGEVLPAPLLRAGLDDLLRALGELQEGVAVLEGARHRLLEVHVLAGGDRVGGHLQVPVVGAPDQDRVHVLVVEEAAVVGVLRRGGPGDLDRLQHPRLVRVAHRHHLAAGQLLEQAHQVAGAAPGADDADADAVVRAEGLRASEARPEGEGGAAGDRGAQEAAAVPGGAARGHSNLHGGRELPGRGQAIRPAGACQPARPARSAGRSGRKALGPDGRPLEASEGPAEAVVSSRLAAVARRLATQRVGGAHALGRS